MMPPTLKNYGDVSGRAGAGSRALSRLGEEQRPGLLRFAPGVVESDHMVQRTSRKSALGSLRGEKDLIAVEDEGFGFFIAR
jgi:hypothetical protein